MALPQWMKDDLKFSDEQLAAMEPHFTPERVELLNKGYLRQQDYSRKMDEGRADVKRQQDELATANERLTAEMAEWATSRAAGDTASQAQIAAMEAAQADVLRLQQALQRTATQYGFDPTPLLQGIAPAPTPKPAAAAVDTSQFVSRSDMGPLAEAMLTAPAELAALQHEHHQITGEWLDPRTLITELKARAARPQATRGSLDLRDIWSDMHGIPEKRQAADKKKFDDAITEAENRGRLAARTEAAIPGAAPSGRMSPAFKNADGTQRQSVLSRGQPMTGVQKTAASLVRIRAEQQAAGARRT